MPGALLAVEGGFGREDGADKDDRRHGEEFCRPGYLRTRIFHDFDQRPRIWSVRTCECVLPIRADRRIGCLPVPPACLTSRASPAPPSPRRYPHPTYKLRSPHNAPLARLPFPPSCPSAAFHNLPPPLASGTGSAPSPVSSASQLEVCPKLHCRFHG